MIWTTTPDVYTHSSGLTVLHERRTTSPVVALQMWVNVGSGDESEREAGLAHVHEHMLFKGTESRAVGAIARDVEAVGGSINAWTSFDQTVYHVVMPSRFAQDGLDVLVDAIRHSAFDPDELERELQVIQEEIRRGEDMPPRVLSQRVFSTVFETHPYGRPVIGTSESVDAFERADVLSFFERWYRPDNITLVAVGDVTRAELDAWLDDMTAGWSAAPTTRNPRPVEPPQTALRTVVEQRDVERANLNLAWRGPGLADEDTPALELLSILLGQGDSSRLFEHVQRSPLGVSGVYAGLYTPAEPGLVLVGASFRGGAEPDDPMPVLSAVVREIARLQHTPPTEAELSRALAILESDAIYQRQTVQGLAQRLGWFHVVGGDVAFEQEFVARARQVTPDRIRDVARRYLGPDTLTVGLMLPESLEAPPTEPDIERVVRAAYADIAAASADAAPVPDAHGIVRYELDGGLVLIVQQDDASPVFAIRAATLGGLLAESEATNGVHHLVAELMTSGTSTRSAMDIARTVDAMAASISGFSGRNSLGLRMTALRRDFDAAIELFADVLYDASFPDDEVDRIRRETLQHIAARRDNPAGLAFQAFNAELYGEHPHARMVMGTADTVAALDRDAIVDAWQAAMRPDRLVVTVVGDVDPARVRDAVEAHLVRPVTDDDAPALDPRPEPPARTAPVRLDDTLDRQQAHIVLGFPGASMFDDDRLALDVLAVVLGGQSGRLFVELRDNQSLAYSVSAWSSPGYDSGSFAFYIATSPERVDEAIDGIRGEIERLRTGGITEDELERAQRYLLGRRDIATQRHGARAGYYAFDELYGFGYAYSFAFADRVEAVTVADVERAIETWLIADREILSVVGPALGETPALAEPPPGADAPE